MATGVIGLGNIGGAIAANLVADGNDVVVYDVDPAAVQAISGATAAPDVASVAGQADVTLLSLPTPEVVSEVAAAWAGSATPGAVLVDLSTNSPVVVRELGERLAASGHYLVEAPLTGGAIGAEKRMLVFMVGGEEDPVGRVIPVLEPLGRATFHVGPLGLGNTMKLLNSLIAFTTTWVSLEGLALATKAGIDVQKAVEILRTAGASNFFIDRQVETIDGRNRPTQFALELAAKDAGLIVDTGSAVGAPTPVGAAIKGVLDAVVAEGLGGADWSELVTFAERQADVALRWEASLIRPEHVGCYTQGRPRGGNAGVNGHVHEDLDDLLAGNPHVERPGKMRPQLLGLPQRGQQGHGDHGAVAHREPRPRPDVAERALLHVVEVLRCQLGRRERTRRALERGRPQLALDLLAGGPALVTRGHMPLLSTPKRLTVAMLPPPTRWASATLAPSTCRP